MSYWYHRPVYTAAEQLGFTLLSQLPEHGAPRGERWLEFTDGVAHAEAPQWRHLEDSGQNAALRRATSAFTENQFPANQPAPQTASRAFADDPPEPAPTTRSRQRRRTNRRGRGPVADQAELRYRMLIDIQHIRLEGARASTPTSREANRRFLPWLTETQNRLRTPMDTADLELVAAQWRERRAPFLTNPEWADVIIVDPIPRQPATRRWRRRHGAEPPPPLSPSDR